MLIRCIGRMNRVCVSMCVATDESKFLKGTGLCRVYRSGVLRRRCEKL